MTNHNNDIVQTNDFTCNHTLAKLLLQLRSLCHAQMHTQKKHMHQMRNNFMVKTNQRKEKRRQISLYLRFGNDTSMLF